MSAHADSSCTMLLCEASGALLSGARGPSYLEALTRQEGSAHLKTDNMQVKQDASQEGSNCHSHGSTARAVPPGDKLSGKTYTGLRKSRQSHSAQGPGNTGYTSLTDLSVPVTSVSAFCQAVLSKIIPNEFYGLGGAQAHNRRIFLGNVDRFLKLRRFETISLHEVVQGLKVCVYANLSNVTAIKYGT